jgi:predicted enzyme related to lactoylglutathione lyase
MQHDFCHIELNTNDAEGAKKFYLGLFDWDSEDWPMPQGGTYTIIKPGKGPMGGIMKSPVEHPPMWAVYIAVEDADAAAKKAVKLGGKVIMGKTPVPNMGFFALLQDPQGATFAVWEPIKK